MLSPAYTFDLNQAVLSSLATIGYFDGNSPCLACGTTGGKVFIHSPHTPNSQLSYLNINKTISGLVSGKLENSERDMLLVASPSSLMVYDVNSNSDVFNTDVRDGAFTLALGNVNNRPLALVGGNCSLLGFDSTGEEAFWTVTGDNVTAIGLYNRKKAQRLLVGSEDYAIRVFSNEEMLEEIEETGVITEFSGLSDGKFAYSLDTGVLGVYKNTHRLWKASTKYKVTSMTSGDVNGDGVPEIIAGWSNGKLEIRAERKGECLFKKMIKKPIAKVFYEDYRLEGQNQVIACTTSGSILGFMKNEAPQENQEEQLLELTQQKEALLNQIQSYSKGVASELLPADTKVLCRLVSSPPCIQLSLSNSCFIKHAVLLAEGLFEGETYVFHPERPTHQVQVPIENNRHVQSQVEIKLLVSNSAGSIQSQVISMPCKIPKFSDFEVTECNLPSSYVMLDFNYDFTNWANERFILESKLQPKKELKLTFKGKSETLGFSLTGRNLIVYTETLELAGEVIQDLIVYFSIPNLQSKAYYPNEVEKLKELLEKVDEFNSARTDLTVSMAESTQFVKAFIVKAEDARIQNNMEHFKQELSNLQQFNGELLSQYQIRSNNHNELLSCLKQLNQYIQKGANLRSGEYKNRTLAAGKQAVKARDVSSLQKVIFSGG